jgi:hypothetical protein
MGSPPPPDTRFLVPNSRMNPSREVNPRRKSLGQ